MVLIEHGSLFKMKYQEAYNNIECKLINHVGRVLVFEEEWESIKSELQRLGKIEDSVRIMGDGNERSKGRSGKKAKS